MKNLILILATAAALTACSSSLPIADSPATPAAHTEKQTAPAKATSAGRPYSPPKPMKCKFDTDCVVMDSCASNKCKITGNDCRFRSDCPSPRGTCINDKCEFR